MHAGGDDRQPPCGAFLLKLSVTEKGQNLLRHKITNMLFLLACTNCRQTRLNDDAHTYTTTDSTSGHLQTNRNTADKHGHDTGSIKTRTRHRKYHTITVEASVCDPLVRESTRLTLVFWTISLRALTPYLDSTVDISHWHRTPHHTVHGTVLTTRQSWLWYDTVGMRWWTASLRSLMEPQSERITTKKTKTKTYWGTEDLVQPSHEGSPQGGTDSMVGRICDSQLLRYETWYVKKKQMDHTKIFHVTL